MPITGELRALDLLSSDIINNFILKRQALDPGELLETVKKSGVDVHTFYNSTYPAALREITDPPLVLFSQGAYDVEDIPHSVAVVGTRKPSSYGRALAKEIARGLAQNGATIISGMAVGIDSLAHWGAIECGGKTLAVLGCAVDVCYPSSNRPLYEKLCSGTAWRCHFRILSRHQTRAMEIPCQKSHNCGNGESSGGSGSRFDIRFVDHGQAVIRK